MKVPPLPRTPGGTRRFLDAYTQGLSKMELERLFTQDAPDAYRFFSRAIDFAELRQLPWHRRALAHARLFFLAFTLRLTPARRAIYAVALMAAAIGMFELMIGVHLLIVPHPVFARGTLWLITAFVLVNLIVLLEVADRLTLKNDLEIARDIQQAMLPRGAFSASGLEAFGMTRPANTVGGDFYDIVPLADGRVLFALGMFEDAAYSTGRVELHHGDVLVMYSDGITVLVARRLPPLPVIPIAEEAAVGV